MVASNINQLSSILDVYDLSFPGDQLKYAEARYPNEDPYALLNKVHRLGLKDLLAWSDSFDALISTLDDRAQLTTTPTLFVSELINSWLEPCCTQGLSLDEARKEARKLCIEMLLQDHNPLSAAGLSSETSRRVLQQSGLFKAKDEQSQTHSLRSNFIGGFLVAEYLCQSNLTDHQLISLLLCDPHGIRPQWYELAMWLAAMREHSFWLGLVEEDSAAALHCFDHNWTHKDKTLLVDALIKDLPKLGEAPIQNNHLWKLAHPTIAEQLRPLINNQDASSPVRYTALAIAGASQVRAVQRDILDLATSQETPDVMRWRAASALKTIDDALFADELIQLLHLPEELDHGDVLRGVALTQLCKHASWTISDVTPHLRKPTKANLLGEYLIFLTQTIPSKLKANSTSDELLDWLHWLESAAWPRFATDLHERYLSERMLEEALDLAIERLDRPEVAILFAQLLVSIRWKWRTPFNKITRTLKNSQTTRLALIPLMDPLARTSPESLMASYFLDMGCYQNKDIPFLLKLAEETTQKTLSETYLGMARELARIDEPTYFDAIVDHYNKDPESNRFLRPKIKSILGSPAAQLDKEMYQQPPAFDEEHSFRADEGESPSRSPKTKEESMSRAWLLVLGKLYQRPPNEIPIAILDQSIRRAPGWHKATGPEHSEVLSAAFDFLENVRTKAETHTLTKTPSLFVHDALGLLAFQILLSEQPTKLEQLPPSAWKSWAVPFLRFADASLIGTKQIAGCIPFFLEYAADTVDALLTLFLRRRHPMKGLEPFIDALASSGENGLRLLEAALDIERPAVEHLKTALDALLEHQSAHAQSLAWNFLGSDPPAKGGITTRHLTVLTSLASHVPTGWSRIWSYVKDSPAAVERVLLDIDFSPNGSAHTYFGALSVQQLEELWLWMARQYPPSESVDPSTFSTDRQRLSTLRNTLFDCLCRKNTAEAVSKVEELSALYPRVRSLRNKAERARRDWMQKSLVPICLKDIEALSKSPDKIWISTLRGLHQESHSVLKSWLCISDARQSLWERVENDRFQPVSSARWANKVSQTLEAELTKRVPSSVTLKVDCQKYTVHVSIEFQNSPDAASPRLDVLALMNSDPDLRDCIENAPKASATALSSIVVGCFSGPAWTRRQDHERRGRSARNDLDTLRKLYARDLKERLWLLDATFEESEGDMARHLPFGRALLDDFNTANIEVKCLHSVGGNTRWEMECDFPEELQESFGLNARVMCLATTERLGIRSLEHTRQEMQRSDHLIDRDLVLLPGALDTSKGRLRTATVEGFFQQPVFWNPEDSEPLTVRLWDALPAFDVFDRTLPCRGSQVFGREQEITNITRRILRGESVGIYGLRKVGKTTLIRAVTDRLDPLSIKPKTISGPSMSGHMTRVIFMDAQVILGGTEDQLIALFQNAIHTRMQAEGLPIHSGKFSWQSIRTQLESLLDNHDARLCICIEESDYLFRGEDGFDSIGGANALFGLLRGLAQLTERVSIVLLGRDPMLVNRPEVNGVANPVFNWFVDFWTGPFNKEEARHMMATLCLRVGLEMQEETFEAAWDWTGGHPTMIRQFGSALFDAAQGHPRQSAALETNRFLDAAEDIFLEHKDQANTHIPDEITVLLKQSYPGSWQLLLQLSHTNTPRDALNRMVWRSPSARTLRRFGILQGSSDKPFVPTSISNYIRWSHARPSQPQGALNG